MSDSKTGPAPPRGAAARLYFLVPTAVLLIVGAIALVLYPKGDLHLALNSVHNPVLDTFFAYVTHLGSGQFAALVALGLLFVRFRYALYTGLSCTLAGLLVQLLKRTIFAGAKRPAIFFWGSDALQVVPGVDLHYNHSFPSGHAAAAFCLYFMLALIVGRRGWSVVFFIIATLVAYSRVYLSQHFLSDVYFSAILGVGIAGLTWWWFERRVPRGTSDLMGWRVPVRQPRRGAVA